MPNYGVKMRRKEIEIPNGNPNTKYLVTLWENGFLEFSEIYSPDEIQRRMGYFDSKRYMIHIPPKGTEKLLEFLKQATDSLNLNKSS